MSDRALNDLIAAESPRAIERLLAHFRNLPRLVLIFAFGIVLAMWGLFAALAYTQRETAIERTEIDAANLSAAFEERVTNFFTTINQAADLVQRDWLKDGLKIDFSKPAMRYPELASSIIQVGLIGADGKLLLTSLDSHSEHMDLSDREHVRVPLDHPNQGLFIGKPVIGRVSHQVTIQVTRTLHAADGSVAGVILFSINPTFLADLNNKVELGQTGVITLAGTDGIVRARFTKAGDGTADVNEGQALHIPATEAVGISHGTYLEKSDVDNVTRLVDWRRVDHYGLIVSVGLGQKEALAYANRQIVSIAILAAVLTVVILGFSLLLRFKLNRARQREQLLSEERLRLHRSEEHLARAQRVAKMGSFVRDLRSGRMEWSDETYRIYGVARDAFALTLENIGNLIHPEDRVAFMAANTCDAGAKAPSSVEQRIIRPDGALRITRAEREIVSDGEGNPVILIGTLHDVTEQRAIEEKQKQLEEQLLHSQRLESLGTLAGGIAHDLNNTLVPILALSKMVLADLPKDSPIYEDMEMVALAGERAHDLVTQILAFSRKESIIKTEVDLADVTRSALHMLRAATPTTIQIVEAIKDVPALLGDFGQLHQVVVNLVTNAAHAIGEGVGQITVSLASVDPASGSHELPASPAIRLVVADTGCGIDDATIGRIFEPFFTTKEVGVGTGLGLSVVHGIVANHGGSIKVSSTPGIGTRFEVILPGTVNETASDLAA